jgi:hypothetical protein
MKQLSQRAEQERESTGNSIYWILEIDWPDATRSYSSRQLQLGERTYQPWLLDVGAMRLELARHFEQNTGVADHVSVRLLKAADSGEGLGELLERYDAEGLGCRIGTLFQDRQHQATLDDIIWLQEFVIEEVVLGTLHVEFRLEDLSSSKGLRKVGRRNPEQDASGSSREYTGEILPIVFGRVADCPLVPLHVGARTRLRKDLVATDTVAHVESVAEFSPQGTLQIGDELISFVAVDADARTLGTPESPLVRLQPSYHRNSAVVRQVPAGGFEFLVADHPCAAVGDLKADGAPVEPDQYNAVVGELGGAVVQKVVFPVLPTKAEYASATTVLPVTGATFEGCWATGSGNSAMEAFRAYDPNRLSTAATVSREAPALEVEFRGDLSQGQSRYGELVGARLGIVYFASQRWHSNNVIRLGVRKGALEKWDTLVRASSEEVASYAAEHTHRETIEHRVSDSRVLFAMQPLSDIISFDSVEGERTLENGNAYWANAATAHDGDFSSFTQNFSGPDLEECREPLRFKVKRKPNDDAGVRLTQVSFQVHMDSAGTAAKDVEITVQLGDKYRGTTTVPVDSTPRTYAYSVAVQDVTCADMVSEQTHFSVCVPDGTLVRVYEAWVEVHYTLQLKGQTQALGQERLGRIEKAEPLETVIPTPRYEQRLDVTELTRAAGGWAFFAPSGETYPTIRVEFGSGFDTAKLYVLDVFWEIEYREKVGTRLVEQLSAEVEGLSENGVVVENPADVISLMIRDERFLGLGETAVDSETFGAARAKLAERGYSFARRISRSHEVRELLAGAAHEARSRLFSEQGKYKLVFSEKHLSANEAVFDFSDAVRLNAVIEQTFMPTRTLINRLNVFFQTDYQESDAQGRKVYRRVRRMDDVASQRKEWGIREADFRTEWHASSSDAVILDLGGYVLSQRSLKERLVGVELPLIGIHLERSDVVTLNAARAGLSEKVGEITGVGRLAPHRLEFVVALRPQGVRCWIKDSQTFIEHVAGNSEKYFVILGEKVASLDWVGNLWIAGEVREREMQERAMAQPIEFNQDVSRLEFGVGANGLYTACFALTQEGNLITLGNVLEYADMTGIQMNYCYEGTTTRFSFSLDYATALLAYLVEDQALRMAGEIREQVSFR